MEGLLGNPVIQGLLGGGGPMGVRAQSQQQLAQMMPRGGGGMIGAPSAPAPDRSGAAAIASLGDSVASVITHRAEKNAAEEAKAQKMKALTAHIDSLDIPEEQKVRYRTFAAANPDAMFNVLAKQLTPGERRIVKGPDGNEYYEDTKEPVLPGVKAPAKPAETREINQGGNIVTQEWDGERWSTIAQAPRFQPRAGGEDSAPDFTKGWASVPDGEGGTYAALTPKGISDRIEKPVEAASSLRGYMNKVRDGVRLFTENGNSQALLSSMITFQKALDDGAVVREGDIVLQRSAAGVSSRISQFLEQAATGAPISSDLANQMIETMESFAEQGLNSYRSVIDPLVAEGNGIWGPRSMASVMPDSTYQNIFGAQKPKTDGDPTTTVAAPPLIGESNPSNTSDTSLPPRVTPRFENTDDPKWQRFSEMSPQGRANFLKTLKGNDPLLYLFTLEEVEGRAAVDELERILREGRAK